MNVMRKLWILLLLINIISQINAYNILAIFPFEGRSHFIMFETVCKVLAKNGHQVDVVSHYPLKKPVKNYRDVLDLRGTRKTIVGKFSIEHATDLNNDIAGIIAKEYGNKICELLAHEKMQQFIRNLKNVSPPYDAVIIETFGADCYIGFGHYLNVPVIAMSSSMLPTWIDFSIRNPTSYAYIPHYLHMQEESFDYTRFWHRLSNAVSGYKATYSFIKNTEVQTDILRKHLSPDIPDIQDMRRNINLVLVNTHYSLFGARPLLPNIIELGGIHIEEVHDEMTPELKQWMDESTDGVVYFSLGSLVALETLPENVLRDLLASFTKISPVRVLIKSGKSRLLPDDELPNNIKIIPWIPQVPVLRHNNTRVFITHGGLMGTMEAVYYGTPMIGIPVFGDQIRNIHMCASKNVTIPLSLSKLGKKPFDDALNAMLRTPKYKDAAEKLSRLFRDRPLQPKAAAVFWIEYIIRNGAKALQSPATELYWWQVALVDVYAFLLTVALLVIMLCRYLYKCLCQRIKRKIHKSKKQE